MLTRTLAALAVVIASASSSAAEPVLLHAAGSLRGALTEVASAFEAATKLRVQSKFGASGLLKDEIAGGGKAEVFASANMTAHKFRIRQFRTWLRQRGATISAV